MIYTKPNHKSSLIIKKQVILVEKLIGNKNKIKDLFFNRQKLFLEKKKFEKLEKKIEDKPNNKEKQVSNKITVPRLGFLDVIKNFLFNILLGAFVIKLLPHLPKLKGVVIGAMKFSEFIAQFSISIVNAFATFIDKVYKIVDFGKTQAKLLGGDKGLENYNKALGSAVNVMNLMTIAGMLFSDLITSDSQSSSVTEGMDVVKDIVTKHTTKNVSKQIAIRGAAQFSARAAAGTIAGVGLLSSALGEGAFQLRKHTKKIQEDADNASKEAQEDKNPFMRFIKTAFYNAFARPGLMFTNFLLNGVGTLLDIIGTPFRYAIELINYGIMMLTGDSKGIIKQRENLGKFDARIREQIREHVNTISFGTIAKEKGSFGSLFGSDATKAMGYAQGGEITRGGVYMGKIGRTVGKSIKIRRSVTVPTSPLNPGADVGGMTPHPDSETSKLETFYPNPSDPGMVNSFEYLKKSYSISKSAKFLHPLLEIAIKSLMGDKPPEGDFKSIGTGLNNFLNDILNITKIPGKNISVSDEVGTFDISNWVESKAKESIMDPINSILSNLMYQLTLKGKGQTGSKANPSAQKGDGAGDSPLAEFAGQAQFVIGDSIAHGFAGRSGNGSDSEDTMVGRSPAAVLAYLKSKGDVLKGMLIDLSTGIANNPGDFSSVKAQLSYLKSIGSRVRVLGVADSFSKKTNGLNEKLDQMVKSNGFYFYGGYKGSADGVHGTATDYSDLKAKATRDTAATKETEGQSPTGKGYGSQGSKIAGELGRFMKNKGVVPGSVHRHPEHPPYSLTSGHSEGSLHYQGRAIDLGAYANEQGPVLKAVNEFNKLKGVKPVQLLKAGDPDHDDHVHVAYKEGGPIYKTDYALTHPGEYVIDADSVKLFGINFYDIINQTETITQRQRSSQSLMSILSQYTEDGFPETEDDYTYTIPSQNQVTIIPPQTIFINSFGGGSTSSGEDPSKDSLYE